MACAEIASVPLLVSPTVASPPFELATWVIADLALADAVALKSASAVAIAPIVSEPLLVSVADAAPLEASAFWLTPLLTVALAKALPPVPPRLVAVAAALARIEIEPALVSVTADVPPFELADCAIPNGNGMLNVPVPLPVGNVKVCVPLATARCALDTLGWCQANELSLAPH